jgi:hypothetical protein
LNQDLGTETGRVGEQRRRRRPPVRPVRRRSQHRVTAASLRSRKGDESDDATTGEEESSNVSAFCGCGLRLRQLNGVYVTFGLLSWALNSWAAILAGPSGSFFYRGHDWWKVIRIRDSYETIGVTRPRRLHVDSPLMYRRVWDC